jgi:hypothetical protein
MAITLETVARNAACDAVVDLADAGTGAGILRIRAGSTTLCDIELSDPAFGAASNGVATASGLPLSGTAVASGTADNYQVLDSAEGLKWSGTVGQGSGDLSLDNTSIASSQTVNITSWTHTAPA